MEAKKPNPFGYVFTTSVMLPNGGHITVEGIVTETEMRFSRYPKMVVGATLTAQAVRLMDHLRTLGIMKDEGEGYRAEQAAGRD